MAGGRDPAGPARATIRPGSISVPLRTACLGPTSPVERFPRRDAVGGSGTGQDHTYYRDGATASPALDGITAAPEVEASLRAQQVVDTIRRNGASFFEELVDQSGLLRAEVEEALGELVSLGLVTSDSFAGLRALIMPASRSGARKGRRVRPASGMAEAGRWALARRGTVEARATQARGDRACGPGALGALRRGVLAAGRTGSGMAAAMARTAARLSAPREPWRNPRRALRCGFLR